MAPSPNGSMAVCSTTTGASALILRHWSPVFEAWDGAVWCKDSEEGLLGLEGFEGAFDGGDRDLERRMVLARMVAATIISRFRGDVIQNAIEMNGAKSGVY